MSRVAVGGMNTELIDLYVLTKELILIFGKEPWRYWGEEDADQELKLEHILWECLRDWSEFQPSWARVCLPWSHPESINTWARCVLIFLKFRVLKPLIFCWWIRLNDNADLRWENRWIELLNEILDRKWLNWCLSHRIELAFRWWMSNWCLSPACWLKIDVEHRNQWTWGWLPWFLTSCPVWIRIAADLNWKFAILISDRKLRLHDEDEVSCLIDILEKMN